tara:strand:+ start:45 stop:1892 length:1848 start_codon:yes stop_codon:yes gene_type:complete
MAKSFEETVSDLTEEFGTRGFTAKKTAAADLLGGDIEKARGENASESIVVASVLDNLETAQRDLESSRDPETSKEILKTVNDLKQVVKNLRQAKEDPLDEKTADRLDDLLNKTERNVKKVAKSGGAFGKANETFLGSLTETLNPLSALGNFFGTAGITPLEGYFNSLGDSLNEKVKSALGYGASEESMNITRDIQKQQRAEIDTADQEQAVMDQSVLTKEGETSSKSIEEGEGSMNAEDLLLPSLSLVKRARLRLGFALGLTDASGKPYLGMLVDFLKPDPASRAEVSGVGDGVDLDAGAVGEFDEEDIKKTGGLLGILKSGFVNAFATIASFLGIKTIGSRIMGFFKGIGGRIVARIGLRGALAGTLAGIPVVGWIAALVIQAAFGIFDGIKNFLTVSKDPSATIGDKIFGFLDGFISGFFTLGFASPEAIKNFRGKISDGFGNMLDGLEGGLNTAVTTGVNTAKGMADAFEKDIVAPIADAGRAVANASQDFLKGTLRSVLPRGTDYGMFDPRKYVQMAIPESVYDFAGLDKKTGEEIAPEAPVRAELTSDMRTAMSDMSNLEMAQGATRRSVSMATQNNLNNSSVTNNTINQSSPQDKDFDYYAFRGPMVHA